MKAVVTGARGLIGWHAAARLHAANCAATFRGEAPPYRLERLGHVDFQNPATLDAAVADADMVLHFAGINRDTDERVEHGNAEIAETLAGAVKRTGARPTIVYANSTHAASDTPYGRGKRRAAEILAAGAAAAGGAFADLTLPHIFGEGGRPFYNNVTGTLCHQVASGEEPTVNPAGRVELVHAGDAAQRAIDLGLAREDASHRMEGFGISIPDLLERIRGYHRSYTSFVFPDVSDPFDLALFNTYRQHLYPAAFPIPVKVNTDARGRLFETVKGGGGGQSFISWTEPGVTRGEHFHLHKVERFLVVEGTARIEMRRVLAQETHAYEVSGDDPACVDMPTLWTHNITNTGKGPLITVFWTHDIFDPAKPDTYADKVHG